MDLEAVLLPVRDLETLEGERLLVTGVVEAVRVGVPVGEEVEVALGEEDAVEAGVPKLEEDAVSIAELEGVPV